MHHLLPSINKNKKPSINMARIPAHPARQPKGKPMPKPNPLRALLSKMENQPQPVFPGKTGEGWQGVGATA
jgi:hypothetical protein